MEGIVINPERVTVPDPQDLAREAAQRFTSLAREAAASRGRFSVALSGGSTPGALYRLLAREPYQGQIPWEQVHLFWGDERCVPPNDPGSNFRLASDLLIDQVPIPTANIHRVRGELEPDAAARSYEQDLDDYFCGPRTRFDLVLLGVGGDGHTASLFPGSPSLRETGRLALAVEAHYGDRPSSRVTLTLPAINSSRHIWFLVTGGSKASIVQAVLEGEGGDLPAQQICPTAGVLTWLLDAGAASQLEQSSG